VEITMQPERPAAAPQESDPTVIFLHIGKTAGTTLRVILRRQFRPSQVMLVRARMRPREETLTDFARLPEAERDRPRLIMGHTVFGLHRYVPRPSTYVTVLRRPVSLVLSQYNFVRRTVDHRHHQVVTSRNMSLQEYIASGVSLEMDNSQTRAIAGDLSTPFGECTSQMLEAAKDNLDRHFAVAGLTERFDETLLLLGKAFGWRRLHYVPANVSPRAMGEQLEPATREAIEEQNRLDLDLYQHVGDRFGETIRRYPAFDRDLSHFRTINSIYRPWGQVRYVIPRRLYGAVRQRVGASRS
jgi:hypothetical protein